LLAAPAVTLGAGAQTPGICARSLAGMLYAIAIILILLWLLGLVTSATMGGFIHVLLVIAVIMIVLKVISRRNPI
jgi:hypothetical protein